jgi:hypothetical protein
MGIMWKNNLYQGRTIDYTSIYYLNKFTQLEDLLPYLLNRPRRLYNIQPQITLRQCLCCIISVFPEDYIVNVKHVVTLILILNYIKNLCCN